METRNRAGGIIINSRGKIVLANEYLWVFPRGGIEIGESDIEAGWFTMKEILTQLTDEKDRAFFMSKIGIIRKLIS